MGGCDRTDMGKNKKKMCRHFSPACIFAQGCIFWPGGLFFSPSSLKGAYFLPHFFGLHPPPLASKKMKDPPPRKKFVVKLRGTSFVVPKNSTFWAFKYDFVWQRIFGKANFIHIKYCQLEFFCSLSIILPMVLALKLKSKLLKKIYYFLLWQLKLFVGKLSSPRFKVWLPHNKIQVFQSLKTFAI